MSLQAATSTLRLRVRFFGPVRSRLKTDACEIAWPADASADEFWTRLISQFPEIASARPTTRLARNGEFLGENERLHPGDEVALIPPVSGG
jgi:molybdopterin converting factor small subunit